MTASRLPLAAATTRTAVLSSSSETDIASSIVVTGAGARIATAWRWTLRGFYAVCTVLVLASIVFVVFQPIQVLPRLSLSPGFSLVDPSGQKHTSEDYRGRVVLFSFVDPNHGDATARVISEMQSIRGKLAAGELATLRPGLVTILVNASGSILNEMAAGQLPDGHSAAVSWELLTGEPARIRNVVGGGFGVYFPDRSATAEAKFNPAATIADGRVVLVDGTGLIRAEYPLATFDPDRVLADLSFINAELRNRQGLTHLAYEAAHLFRCYR